MIITQNLKNKVKLAKKRGYTHVSSDNICRHYVTFEAIINGENNTTIILKRESGQRLSDFQAENPNAKIITYKKLNKNSIINNQ